MERVHHRGRRGVRRQQRVPRADLDAAHALLRQRRNRGRGGRARGLGHSQRAQRAGADKRRQRGQRAKQDRHLPAHHIVERLRGAFVRHMQQRDAGLLAEQLAGQVQAAAYAGAGIAKRRIGALGQRHQFRHGVGAHGRMHRQDIGRARQQRDRAEVPLHVVGQRREQRGVDGQVAGWRHQQGAAVARRAAHRVDADIAVGPGLVVHHHGKPTALVQTLRERAREQVGRAGCREWHNDAQRAAGEGGLRGPGHRCRANPQAGEREAGSGRPAQCAPDVGFGLRMSHWGPARGLA